MTQGSWAAVSLLSWACFACDRPEPEPALGTKPAVGAPRAATPDRLPPGELLEGEARVFGLAIPRDMTLQSLTEYTAEAKGQVPTEALAAYLRQRVLVNHVEMAERRLAFPQVQLRGDDSGTVLRLEIVDDRTATRLIVHNVTPAPVVQGLSDEERWRRAGFKRGGQLIDPQKLE